MRWVKFLKILFARLVSIFNVLFHNFMLQLSQLVCACVCTLVCVCVGERDMEDTRSYDSRWMDLKRISANHSILIYLCNRSFFMPTLGIIQEQRPRPLKCLSPSLAPQESHWWTCIGKTIGVSDGWQHGSGWIWTHSGLKGCQDHPVILWWKLFLKVSQRGILLE